MTLNVDRRFVLGLILIANIISTGIHFTDNYLFIKQYPQPEWITAPSIYQSWIVLTAIGIAGYWLYRAGKFWLAYPCLLIFSLAGLASPGHYLYGTGSQFSLKMHLFIWTDALVALTLVGFVVRAAYLDLTSSIPASETADRSVASNLSKK